MHASTWNAARLEEANQLIVIRLRLAVAGALASARRKGAPVYLSTRPSVGFDVIPEAPWRALTERRRAIADSSVSQTDKISAREQVQNAPLVTTVFTEGELPRQRGPFRHRCRSR
jgi:hypothetical protein